ncbi:DoxX family protein [Novosphingobium sp. M1R2S20]|uniref:DoxX family protein n=1 Tax=Novosphingobium rhizovicinum TaxID=3228928 RepID=A0ABV3RA99_9SPHN
MSKIAAIIGRVLIGILFIASGISKLLDINGTNTMITSVGLPDGLAVPVALLELIGGLCLAAGFAVRLVAIILALFTAATILFFHNRFTDPNQAVAALKNLAIIGGLALAFAHSQMWWHYYSIRTAREGELATRDAERRVHEAELRAARAEAAAEAVSATVATAAPETHLHTNTAGEHSTHVATNRRRWFDW